MPLDISDIPSPSISWNVGKGYIETKFDWTKHFIIYLHSSIKDECERVRLLRILKCSKHKDIIQTTKT